MKRTRNTDAENLICLIVGTLLASVVWMALFTASAP
jgi:hypothetical protein